MPTARVQREPVLESLVEPNDGAQLEALNRRDLWPRASVVWRQEQQEPTDAEPR
jgi:hypothetical protein